MVDTNEWPQVTPREKRVICTPGAWHNPTGENIRQLSTDLWVVERGYVADGMDIGGKTVIIRLLDRRLFVHSPLPLDSNLKTCIDNLGTVSAVVAPNAQHLDFIVQWKKHYPNAVYLGPPGIKAKRPNVPFDAELSPENNPHSSYKDEAETIEQIFIPCAPFMRETVFFHRPSKTLVVTDFVFTYSREGVHFRTRLAHLLVSNVFWALYTRFLVKDKKVLSGCLDHIEAWEFEALVPTHGQVVTENAMAAFKKWHGRA